MNPFEVRTDTNPGLVLVIHATLAYKHSLLALDPWLPFPQNSCCYSFGPEGRPLPIGALFILWERWPAFTGQCPECGAKVYGYGFGGMLSTPYTAGSFRFGGCFGGDGRALVDALRHLGASPLPDDASLGH